MSWDDEDFDTPVTKAAPAAAAAWEEEEDDEVLESWEIDEEEVARQKKEAEAQKQKEKAELKRKQEEAKAKKLGKRAPLEIDELDEETRKELLREAELNADLNNAADLFGGLGVAGDDDFDINAHPRERVARAAAAVAARQPVMNKDTPIDTHPLFQPTNKQEFEKLRKAVGPALTNLAEDSLLNYSSGLAIDLIRDLAQPLTVESLRKVLSTLNVVIKDKEREERQARLKKAGGTSTGGAGKKKAKTARPNMGGPFKKDGLGDMDDFDDDLGDDDFM